MSHRIKSENDFCLAVGGAVVAATSISMTQTSNIYIRNIWNFLVRSLWTAITTIACKYVKETDSRWRWVYKGTNSHNLNSYRVWFCAYFSFFFRLVRFIFLCWIYFIKFLCERWKVHRLFVYEKQMKKKLIINKAKYTNSKLL